MMSSFAVEKCSRDITLPQSILVVGEWAVGSPRFVDLFLFCDFNQNLFYCCCYCLCELNLCVISCVVSAGFSSLCIVLSFIQCGFQSFLPSFFPHSNATMRLIKTVKTLQVPAGGTQPKLIVSSHLLSSRFLLYPPRFSPSASIQVATLVPPTLYFFDFDSHSSRSRTEHE